MLIEGRADTVDGRMRDSFDGVAWIEWRGLSYNGSQQSLLTALHSINLFLMKECIHHTFHFHSSLLLLCSSNTFVHEPTFSALATLAVKSRACYVCLLLHWRGTFPVATRKCLPLLTLCCWTE